MATAQLERLKRCTKCLSVKSETAFHTKGDGKFRAQCKDCINAHIRERIRNTPKRRLQRNVGAQNWRNNNLEHVRAYAHDRRLRQTYGISRSHYMVLLDKQGGVCAICQSPPKGLHLNVDHCHETGRVRGLLCAPCNLGLGKLGDTLEAITRARDYLAAEDHSSFNDTLKGLK